MSASPDTWPPADAVVLDSAAVATLRELEGEDLPDLFAESAELFLGDTGRRLEQLREAMAAGDADTVRRVAHTLKGAALVMGTRRLAAACAGLETTAAGGRLDMAGGWWTRVTEEYVDASSALRAEVARGVHPT